MQHITALSGSPAYKDVSTQSLLSLHFVAFNRGHTKFRQPFVEQLRRLCQQTTTLACQVWAKLRKKDNKTQ